MKYKKLLIYLIGLAGTCVGVSLCLKSSLGLDAWNTCMARLSEITPITLGQWTIIVQGSFWILATLLSRRVDLAAIFPIIYKGVMLDLIKPMIFSLPSIGGAASGGIEFSVGYLFLGITTGAYIATGYSRMPVDALMTALAGVLKKDISFARLLIELAGFVSMIAVGGKIGIGTVIFTFTCGRMFAYFKTKFEQWMKEGA